MTMGKLQINGKVVDSKTHQGLEGLLVEVWDQTLFFKDIVGAAVTDESGQFTLENDTYRFRLLYNWRLFFNRAPDLYFKVYRDKLLIRSTKNPVLWNVGFSETPLTIEIEGIEDGAGEIMEKRSKQIFLISGRVINRQTKKVLPGLRVEAWDKDLIIDDFVGKAVTDEYGAFRIEFRETYFREIFLDRRPDLYFKIFQGTKLIRSTEDSILWNVKAGDTEVMIEIDVAEEEGEFVVHGQIRKADASLLVGAKVRAFDKDLRTEEPLGETATDIEGRYEICYTAEQFSRAEKKSADLIVRAFDSENKELVSSGIIFNAQPVETVDLIVGGGQYLGPSEYEKLMEELRPILQGLSPSDLREDAEYQDITFLANETGIERERIDFLRIAALHSVETKVFPEVFYAFFLQGFPTDLGELLKKDQTSYRKALENALEDNVIPLRIKASLDDILALLAQLKLTHTLDDSPEPGVTPVRTVLATTLETPEKQQTFIDLYTNLEGSIEEFWNALRKHLEFKEGGVVDKLQDTLRIGFLTHNHAPLVQHLQKALSNGELPLQVRGGSVQIKKISKISDLAKLNEADWLAQIQSQTGDTKIGFPELTPGDTDEAKTAYYAKTITATIEAAFPTQFVASRVAEDAGSGADDLGSFFGNNPEFDIHTTRVDAYLAEHPNALASVTDKEATVARLNSMQRTYRLTAGYTGMRALVADGLDSARAISKIPVKDFTARYAPELGGAVQANRVYQKARRSAALVLALYGKFGMAMNATKIAAIPTLPTPGRASSVTSPGIRATAKNLAGAETTMIAEAAEASTASIPDWSALFGSQIPDWSTLFGSQALSFCECEHCRSVYSPAAYFVDLLNFLCGDGKYTLSNTAPTLAHAIPDQKATEDVAFRYTVAAETFADIDAGDVLSYTASGLPSWLQFDGATRTFSGTPTNSDVGTATITVRATDSAGDFAEGSFNIKVINVNDAPTGAPTITGAATEDQTLTADTSAIADADGLGAFGYQWTRNGTNIDGATGSSYTLGDADVGAQIRVVVSYTDGGGTVETLTSAPVGPVANVNDAPTGSVTIDDTTPTQGQTLTASNTLADADGLGPITYRWQRGGVDIAGATGATYTTTQADVGQMLRVIASYTDGQGTAESVASADTAAVTNVNDAPTLVQPIPDQVATENVAFRYTVAADTFRDIDAGDVLSYTASSLPGWLQFDGATRTFSGTPTNSDVGTATITVRATDSAGAFAEDHFNIAVKSAELTVDINTLNLTVRQPFPVSASFSKEVTGLSVNGISVTNGQANQLTGNGKSWSFQITPIRGGLVTVQILPNAAKDSTGKGNSPSNSLRVNYLPVTTTALAAQRAVSSHVSGTSTSAQCPLDILFNRRPDIADIELSCKNTNTELPYVDLVNELLEFAVSPQTSVSARKRQTTSSKAELLAYPEYLNEAAYDVLKETRYPWDLPFHLWWEEVRGYFEYLGIKRPVLMETFQKKVTEGEHVTLLPLDIDIAAERLDLTPFERDVIIKADTDPAKAERLDLTPFERDVIIKADTDPAKVAANWGLDDLGSENLNKVSTLLRRSNLNFEQLKDVLATAFVRQALEGGSCKIEPKDSKDPNDVGTCDTEKLFVQPPITVSALDRFHRFVRLWRRLGWTVQEVDRAITLLGSDTVDESFLINLLINLAEGKRLMNELKLPVDKMLDFWDASQTDRDAKLAKLLDIPPSDLQTLITLTGMSPFSKPAAMTEFVKRVRRVKRSSFTAAQLQYLYLNAAAPGDPIAPLKEDVIRLLKGLQDSLSRIAGETTVPQILLCENFVKQTLSNALGLDSAVTGLLLGLLLKARTTVGTTPLPAMNDYLALLGNGLSATYYQNTDLSGPKATKIETSVDFSWGSGSPDPSITAGNFSARFQGKLFVPEREGYTFSVWTSGGIRLKITGQQSPIIDEWNNTVRAEFRNPEPLRFSGPDQLYDFVLEFTNTSPDAFLRLSWSSLSTPQETVPQHRLFATDGLTSLDPVLESFSMLQKAALFINTFKITSRELAYLADHNADFAKFDLNTLPIDPAPFDSALFKQWERLQDVVELRNNLPRGDKDLFDLFAAASVTDAKPDEVKTLIAAVTGWDQTDVNDSVDGFGFKPADFKNEIGLLRLRESIALRKRLGIPISKLFAWAGSPPDQAQAEDVRKTVRAKHETAQWLEKARPLRDVLRERQRAALVSYLVARPKPDQAWDNANGLYNYFLADVEMSPCQLTSRVKLAISSVQLFIHRSLMNLEPEVSLSPEQAKHWREWMRSYRVWEANRKVFLYPENWIYPELRDDKSPFFKDLENELQQNDITNESAESALLLYLEKLDGVARLQICGMYHEREEVDDSKVDILHVVARSFGSPSLYYYRKRVDSAYWTPWEKIEVDIEGDHLIPVIFNRRLYLFWPVFTEKTAKDVAIPAANAAGAKPQTFFEIKLAWSECKEGKWSAKKVSPTMLTTAGLSISRDDYIFKARFDDFGNLAIGCYARGIKS